MPHEESLIFKTYLSPRSPRVELPEINEPTSWGPLYITSAGEASSNIRPLREHEYAYMSIQQLEEKKRRLEMDPSENLGVRFTESFPGGPFSDTSLHSLRLAKERQLKHEQRQKELREARIEKELKNESENKIKHERRRELRSLRRRLR